MKCAYCNAHGANKGLLIFENEYCEFRVKPQKILSGSGIIVPKRHCESVFELTQNEWNATWELLQMAKDKIADEIGPDGWNLGWNIGEAGDNRPSHSVISEISITS